MKPTDFRKFIRFDARAELFRVIRFEYFSNGITVFHMHPENENDTPENFLYSAKSQQISCHISLLIQILPILQL